VQGHLDGDDARVLHHRLGDARRDRLDQVARLTAHDRGRALGELAVVQGVGQVVGGGGGREVHPHGEVHDELLPVAALVLEHPVVAPHQQAAQLDPVGHGVPSPAARAREAPRFHAVATATASSDEATSCTRTPTRRGRRQPADHGGGDVRARGRAVPSASASRWRGTACATPRPAPEPERDQRPAAQQGPAVGGRLREAQPGVEQDQRGVDARQHRRVDARHQLGAHLADDVLVARGRVRGTPPVHEHPRHARGGDDARHVWVGQATRHVVDEHRARLDGRGRHRRAGGVDAHRHAVRGGDR
jgi:hypothetical protein